MQNFIRNFEESIKQCWKNPAISDYHGTTRTYGEVATEIEKLHLVWRNAGVDKGCKISLNARSSSNWAIAFMAATSGGYVAVQLFNGFTATDTQKFVHHSDSNILFTEKNLFEAMDFESMPQLVAVYDIKDMTLLASRGKFADIHEQRESLFATAYPNEFKADDVKYPNIKLNELCCINYTSGSTGTPKGVMLSARNISSNVKMIPEHFPYRKGDNYLSILPFAHIFGLLYDMITPLCCGMHVTVFGMPPAPTLLKEAMQIIRPKVAMMVPLVLNKMTEYAIGEFVHSKSGEARLADYKHHAEFCNALRTIMLSYLGNNCELIVTGGAAIPSHLEQLLAIKLEIPLVTGYGMTECAPTISLGHLGRYKLKSCGEIVERMEAHINSYDPHKTVGELWVRGDNVFMGYYKNPEADREVFTEDGWFRTGDLGTLDEENTLFLVGRCKSMLLASNGQNVYPEEIEVKLNTLPYVAESVVVQRGEKFIAIIVPNSDQLANDGVSAETYNSIMEKNIETLNGMIPTYSKVSSYELHEEPFAKTPKGSIKRFMYK